MRATVLRSERLVLVVPTTADIDVITRCCRDAAVQQWTTVPSPYSRDDAEQFVRGVVEPGWRMGTATTWGIRTDEQAPLIGMIGLDGISHGGAEMGFWLCAPARGSGIMSEAVQLVCDFGFASAGDAESTDPGAQPGAGLGLLLIQWHAIAGNVTSASVARRAGFQFEGVRRLGGVQRGTRVDIWSAALVSTDARRPVEDWPPETFAVAP
ncbi:MAG: GNAT family N-acetyltransferase [Microbacteriaceae bacterium]